MDMSQFRKHLQEVEGKLVHPQASAMYEDKKNSGPSLEESIRGVASGQLDEADKLTAGKYGFIPNEKQDDTGKKKVNKEVEEDAGEHKVNFKSTHKNPGGKRGMYSSHSIMKKEDAAAAAAVGGKKKKIAEDTLASYLNDYFGGDLNESTSENEILEAVQHLFEMEAVIAEYLEGDEDSTSEEVYEAIDEYLYAYFGDELTEDLDEESIAAALFDLIETAEATRIVLED